MGVYRKSRIQNLIPSKRRSGRIGPRGTKYRCHDQSVYSQGARIPEAPRPRSNLSYLPITETQNNKNGRQDSPAKCQIRSFYLLETLNDKRILPHQARIKPRHQNPIQLNVQILPRLPPILIPVVCLIIASIAMPTPIMRKN